MHRLPRSDSLTALLACAWILISGCQADESARRAAADSPATQPFAPADIVDLPDQPDAAASSAFWNHWGDGKAELASYSGEIMRYGEPREARTVLIYVTEPHDRRTWVKDDDVDEAHRVNVMKLNHVVKFQTGIYPYSVMTSVFAPVADWGRPRFQPTKITLTGQEWCGHVFHGVWPGEERFLNAMHSYFAGEGDARSTVETPADTLYEDALLIQLRELDGPFNDGQDWSGHLVPSLWQGRKQHAELEPVEATITREETTFEDTPVTRFVVEYADRTVTYDIARKPPHHVVHFKTSDGTYFTLDGVKRLPYWRLNRPGDETYRRDIGLPKEW